MNFQQWFESLPEGKQAVLRDNKWMLAGAAYEAGKREGTPRSKLTKAQVEQVVLKVAEFVKMQKGGPFESEVMSEAIIAGAAYSDFYKGLYEEDNEPTA